LIIVYGKLIFNYRVGQKSDTSGTYITLYERYHFFGPPGVDGLQCLWKHTAI